MNPYSKTLAKDVALKVLEEEERTGMEVVQDTQNLLIDPHQAFNGLKTQALPKERAVNDIQAYSEGFEDDYASLNHVVESFLGSDDTASLANFNAMTTEDAPTVQPVILPEGVDSAYDVSSQGESAVSNQLSNMKASLPFDANDLRADDGKSEKARQEHAAVQHRIPKKAVEQAAQNCPKRLKCFVQSTLKKSDSLEEIFESAAEDASPREKHYSFPAYAVATTVLPEQELAIMADNVNRSPLAINQFFLTWQHKQRGMLDPNSTVGYLAAAQCKYEVGAN